MDFSRRQFIGINAAVGVATVLPSLPQAPTVEPIATASSADPTPYYSAVVSFSKLREDLETGYKDLYETDPDGESLISAEELIAKAETYFQQAVETMKLSPEYIAGLQDSTSVQAQLLVIEKERCHRHIRAFLDHGLEDASHKTKEEISQSLDKDLSLQELGEVEDRCGVHSRSILWDQISKIDQEMLEKKKTVLGKNAISPDLENAASKAQSYACLNLIVDWRSYSSYGRTFHESPYTGLNANEHISAALLNEMAIVCNQLSFGDSTKRIVDLYKAHPYMLTPAVVQFESSNHRSESRQLLGELGYTRNGVQEIEHPHAVQEITEEINPAKIVAKTSPESSQPIARRAALHAGVQILQKILEHGTSRVNNFVQEVASAPAAQPVSAEPIAAPLALPAPLEQTVPFFLRGLRKWQLVQQNGLLLSLGVSCQN